MKPATKADLDRIRTQLRRTLLTLEQHGDEAIRRAQDWATPLSASSGPGQRNGVSDPTGNAAERFDPLRDEWSLLSAELVNGYVAAVAIESRVSRLTRDAVVENGRAGIGFCECGRYCEGTQRNRLSMGRCPSCAERYIKAGRSTVTPPAHNRP